MTVASFTSPAVQELRRLLGRRRDRRESGRFVVEGAVLVSEAVQAGCAMRTQFVPEAALDAIVPGGGEVVVVADDVLGRLGSTHAPQPPVAIVDLPQVGPELLTDAGFVVALDRIADPGNLGTVLRSAEAAGADAVVLTAGSVDPFNPKVVRSSAGALFHMPVVEAGIDTLAAAGLRLVGTSSHDRADRTVTAYTAADLTGRLAIVLGNEAAGLPDDWNDHHGPIGSWITIPHLGRSESLNVAMAATVLVFEAARQRSGIG